MRCSQAASCNTYAAKGRQRMTTEDFTSELFYRVDEAITDIPKHPLSHLWPSDQNGGTPARTAQRSYGSARPRSESCRLPAERCLVWGLVNGSRRAGLILGWGHCHR